MTAQEIIALATQKPGRYHAIIKIVTGRRMLLGVERSKRSRKYKEKYLLEKPIFLPDEKPENDVPTPAAP